MTKICEPAEGSPSFFKVIRYPSSPHLLLPKAFVKRFLEKIPENPIIKTAAGEQSWKLKFVKIGDDYCFADGWDEVVKDAQLGTKDIVVFWLVDESTFQVSFLDAHGCCKHLTFNNTNDCDNDVANSHDDNDDGDDDDDDNGVDNDEVMQDKYLCFQKIIVKSHVYMMWLPRKFVRAAGLENATRIMLKDHEGNEWIMDIKIEVQVGRTKHGLSSGWSIFRDYHQLSEGDICLFKFNKKEGVLNLTQVLKSKKAIKKEDSTEGLKRRRGKQTSGSVRVKIEDQTVPDVLEVKRKRGRSLLQKQCSRGTPVEVKIEPGIEEFVTSKHVVYF